MDTDGHGYENGMKASQRAARQRLGSTRASRVVFRALAENTGAPERSKRP